MALTKDIIRNGERDLQSLTSVVNGTGEVTTRTGQKIKSLTLLLTSILSAPPVGWLQAFKDFGLSLNNKGDPGGNVMAIGTFLTAAALSIPNGTDMVRTSGYGVKTGLGAAQYVYSPDVTASYVAAHPRSSFTSANGRGFRLAEQFLCPEHTGAAGDNSTDDTDAFDGLNILIADAGSAYVCLRAGATYIGGRQVANEDGKRFNGRPFLKGNNISVFSLNMAGAKLKSKAGKFGGFDASGNKTTTSNNLDNSQKAELSSLIQCFQTDVVHISNGLLDGNGAVHDVGGLWGDGVTGRQCGHYGAYIFNCNNVTLFNVHARDFLLDGFGLGYTGQASTTPPTPMTIINCTVKRAGRNCVSLVGGLGTQVINCLFQDAGYCANASVPGGTGFVNSAPASCFDVEAEGAGIRDPIFIGTSFIGGRYSNTCFVTDSGDSSGHRFLKCTFSGNLWLNKPGIVVEDCKIFGRISKLCGGQAVGLLNTRLIRCGGGDTVGFNNAPAPFGGNFMDGEGAGAGVVLEDCDFYLSRSKLNLRNMKIAKSNFTLAMGTGVVTAGDFVALGDGGDWDRVTFQDALGSANNDRPASAVYITTPARASRSSVVPGPNNLVRLGNASGPSGPYDTTTATAQTNSTATDVATVVADLNKLLGNLRASGQMKS